MDFKNWMIIEDDRRHEIESLLDQFILFFKKDGDVFGAGEDSRVVFAKMKHPDDEMPKNWEDESSFSAHDLTKALQGEQGYRLFKKSDLRGLKIIDREEAVQKLDKESPKSTQTQISIVKLGQHHRDDADNFVRTDEE